jgi:ABC-2 type transport system ATP-binding protein
MDLIEAKNLYKVFGETVAVKDVSLRVTAGEIYGLVGPDGAGKTTTIRLLCGAYRPSRNGSIHVAGYDVLKQTEQARSQIGYLPQRFSLYEELTVMENIRFFAEVRGLPAAEWRPRCMEILKFVGLDEFANRRAGQLSGGMKQKLGLAAALVHRPRVLLLDEPTTGVDPVTRQDFWQLIIRLAGASISGDQNMAGGAASPTPGDQNLVEATGLTRGPSVASWGGEGTAVLVSTPYMDEAARCSRVGFMRHGRLVVEGTPTELRLRLEGRVLELAGQPLPLLRRLVKAEPDVENVQMFGDRLHLRVRPGQAEPVMSRLAERIPIEQGEISRLRAIAPQLEDVFMDLLGEEEGGGENISAELDQATGEKDRG